MDLRFDTDQGEETLRILKTCFSNLEAELNSAESSASALVPAAWEAPAAHQFEEMFNNWARIARQCREDLDALCVKLRYEIDEWLQTAERLSA